MNRGERKVPMDIACIMTGFAFLFDLTNILLEFVTFGIGGIAMDLISVITFTVWLDHYNVHLWGSRNVGWSTAATVLDALPFGDMTFPWTIRVATLAFKERHEIPTNITGNISNFNVKAMPDHFRL